MTQPAVIRLPAFWAAALGYKEPGTEHVVMADPEGNEFCVQ
jgi:hypothetical protein